MIKLLFRYCISHKSNQKHPHKPCVLLLISSQEPSPLQLRYTKFGPFVAHEVSHTIKDFLQHLKIHIRNLNSKSNHILNQCICLKQVTQDIQYKLDNLSVGFLLSKQGSTGNLSMLQSVASDLYKQAWHSFLTSVAQ